MALYCNECSQKLGGPDELCGHDGPVGWCCCDDVHGIDEPKEPEDIA